MYLGKYVHHVRTPRDGHPSPARPSGGRLFIMYRKPRGASNFKAALSQARCTQRTTSDQPHPPPRGEEKEDHSGALRRLLESARPVETVETPARTASSCFSPCREPLSAQHRQVEVGDMAQIRISPMKRLQSARKGVATFCNLPRQRGWGAVARCTILCDAPRQPSPSQQGPQDAVGIPTATHGQPSRSQVPRARPQQVAPLSALAGPSCWGGTQCVAGRHRAEVALTLQPA